MKVITFSRHFQTIHPRKGEETFFVQKILLSLIETGDISMSKACEIGQIAPDVSEAALEQIELPQEKEMAA